MRDGFKSNTKGQHLIDVLDIDKVEPGVGYVYRWTNLVNGKMYIGSHSGSKKYYRASGVAIKKAFDKHGMENFRREFLYVGEDYRNEEERLLILVDAMHSPMYYNMMNTAIGVGFGAENPQYGKPGTRRGIKHTDPAKQKISRVHKGKTISEEVKAGLRISMAGPNNPNYGKAMSDEQKAKLSVSAKAKVKSACPHCGLMVDRSNGVRWHFDNCKQKKEKINCQDYQETQA